MNAFEVDLGLSVLCAIRQPGETFTFEVIAEACGVSKERIHQIEVGALDKLARSKLARDLYAERFDKRPVKEESYLQRRMRVRRQQTMSKIRAARPTKPGGPPKWSQIAERMGLSIPACHMIYFQKTAWKGENHRQRLLAIMAEVGVPVTRRPRVAAC